MEGPWAAEGGDRLQKWRVVVHTMSSCEQLTKGGPKCLGLDKGITIHHHKKPACYMSHKR